VPELKITMKDEQGFMHVVMYENVSVEFNRVRDEWLISDGVYAGKAPYRNAAILDYLLKRTKHKEM